MQKQKLVVNETPSGIKYRIYISDKYHYLAISTLIVFIIYQSINQSMLPDGEDMVDEPGHAEGVELLVEELHPQLTGQQRHVLNDSQPHPPLRVLNNIKS